ncbi:SDR family NAD(P)-dependent oxidoreductase [Azospirillum argentinense]
MNTKNSNTSLAGAVELLAGVHLAGGGKEQRLKQGGIAAVVRPPAVPRLEPAAAGRGPAGFYHMELLPENGAVPAATLEGRRVAVLGDPRDLPSLRPGWTAWPVPRDAGRLLPDVTGHLVRGDAPPDVVLAVIDGARFPADGLLGDALDEGQALLNALFAACKELYASLGAERTHVVAVVCNAWLPDGVPNPVTGLFGGFAKSLARDLPKARITALHTDTGVAEVAEVAGLGLVRPADNALAELFVRGGVVSRPRLVPTAAVTRSGSPPVLKEGMVILATGGARGVTAALLEDLAGRCRVKVVALGRTALERTPPELLEMDADSLAAHEAAFYRNALARKDGSTIKDLKRQFQSHVAANEIVQNVKRFRSLGGQLDYLAADLADGTEVDRAVGAVLERHGRIDLVVHGAGTQISRAMTGKTVAEFDSVVATKLAGLRHLYQALARRGLAATVGVHILTSAFSFWGNDGQPDYGAANEALNRLAEAMAAAGRPWSSLAWLGWAGVGMTRGSEYAALAEQRNLYPLPRQEGQELFAALMGGTPAHAANILATPREIAYYRVPVLEESRAPRARIEPIELSLERAGYLKQHLVAGVPTMPGAVELMHATHTASALLGDSPGMEVRDAQFLSFLKSHPGRDGRARVIAKAEAGGQGVRVAIESDFVHPSGRVLRTDMRNFEARMLPLVRPDALPDEADELSRSRPGFFVLDPYVHGPGHVALSGVFDCLRNIAIHELGQTATFELSPELRSSPQAALLGPAILLDALWRLAVIRPQGSRIPLYVPVRSHRVALWTGHGTGGTETLHRLAGARLIATRPEPVAGSPASVLIRHAVAVDAQGSVLVANIDILATTNS